MIDKETLNQHFEAEFVLRDTPGGHMAYDYALLDHDSDTYFIKHHDPATFTDANRESHSRLYLDKESSIYNHLRKQGFVHIPRHNELLRGTTLIMEGLSDEQGWHWRAPKSELLDTYIQDCLEALSALESMGSFDKTYPIVPTHLSFNEEGWGSLREQKQLEKVRRKIAEIRHQLHPHTSAASEALSKKLETLAEYFTTIDVAPTTPLTHHDARQANIAWHPEHGVKIVDWSWAGPGLSKSDSTSFLIDLAKSGIDVGEYLDEHFNPEHALILIGFWLGHSLWPTFPGNESVRLHQIASAATAYELLEARGFSV